MRRAPMAAAIGALDKKDPGFITDAKVGRGIARGLCQERHARDAGMAIPQSGRRASGDLVRAVRCVWYRPARRCEARQLPLEHGAVRESVSVPADGGSRSAQRRFPRRFSCVRGCSDGGSALLAGRIPAIDPSGGSTPCSAEADPGKTDLTQRNRGAEVRFLCFSAAPRETKLFFYGSLQSRL
jgi:hypothetical protein